MNRITEKQLDNLCQYLNELTNSPLEPYSRDENGQCRANIGNYHISHAYGGVCLHRVCNEGGGVSTPLIHGHVPKRELYNAMQAFIKGLDAVRYNDIQLKKAA